MTDLKKVLATRHSEKAATDEILWSLARGHKITEDERDFLDSKMGRQQASIAVQNRRQRLAIGQQLGGIEDIERRRQDVVDCETRFLEVDGEVSPRLAELEAEAEELRVEIAQAASAKTTAEAAVKRDETNISAIAKHASEEDQSRHAEELAAIDAEYSDRARLRHEWDRLLAARDVVFGRHAVLSLLAVNCAAAKAIADLVPGFTTTHEPNKRIPKSELPTLAQIKMWFEEAGDALMEDAKQKYNDRHAAHGNARRAEYLEFALSLIPE